MVEYCGFRARGPLGKAEVVLGDGNGAEHVFVFETFYNGHDALTLGRHIRTVKTMVAVGDIR